MTDYVSPVPTPALDAQAPGPYEGIYGMPSSLTTPTADLTASREFWLRGLGFIDLFSIPGRLTVLTPEGTRVVMTAALPIEPDGERAQWLRDIGIEVPQGR